METPQFTIPVVFRIAIDLGIFDIFIEPDREFSIPEIAEHAKRDELLICKRLDPHARILKALEPRNELI